MLQRRRLLSRSFQFETLPDVFFRHAERRKHTDHLRRVCFLE